MAAETNEGGGEVAVAQSKPPPHGISSEGGAGPGLSAGGTHAEFGEGPEPEMMEGSSGSGAATPNYGPAGSAPSRPS